MTSIFHDFEVPMGTLAGWTQEFKEQGEKSFPGSAKIKPCNIVLQKDSVENPGLISRIKLYCPRP